MPSVTRRAPAKVNLALSVGAPVVGGPRAGWHPIASWMSCLELSDMVTVTPRESTKYRVAWTADAPKKTPIDWTPAQDLAARAHRALEDVVGHRLPCGIVVEKRIPVGGGLGGGSSDAAATLLALRDAFDLPLADSFLVAAAARVGSDVPFFVDEHHRPAVISGFGEVVERTASIAGDVEELLLIVPPFGCSTPAVYGAFDQIGLVGGPVGGPDLEGVRRVATGVLSPQAWFNDLEPAAARIEPRLLELRRKAEEILGTRVMMTGSGSTLIAWQPAAARIGALRAQLFTDRAAEGPFAGCVFVSTRFL